MNARTMISLTSAFALGLASLTVAAPAQARDGWNQGRYEQGYGYDRGYNRGYDNRGYDRGYDRSGYGGGYRDYNAGYRGDNRYYDCGRSDGTAGTIIGAIAGGLLGHEVVGRRGDKTTGTILGGAVGAVAGRAIDKGGNRCR